jgi:hypothetical protein
MVDDDPVSVLETPAPRPGGNYLPAGFMACNDALVAFRAFAQMLTVDGPYVGSADGRAFYPQQNLAMARHGDIELLEFHRTITWQQSASHLAGKLGHGFLLVYSGSYYEPGQTRDKWINETKGWINRN